MKSSYSYLQATSFSPKFEVGIRHEKLKVGGVGSPRALQGCAVRIMGAQRKSKD